MKVRGWRAALPVAALALALLAGACGDEASGPDRVRPTAADMAMVASDMALVAGAGLQQYTTAGLILAASAAPGPAPAAVDTLLRDLVSCPLVLHHVEAASYYELRYGTGCVSGFDGRSTAGAALFTVNDQAPFADYDLSSEFDDFTRDGRRLRGLMDVKGSPVVPLVLEASGLDISGQGSTGFVNAEFELVPADDPCGGQNPLCAAWKITAVNVGAVSTGDYLFNVILQDTLVVSGCYPHFVKGVIAVTSAGTYPALIDFGDGTCDDTATMTVEGRTETITLGYGS